MKDDATSSLDVNSRQEVEWSNELLSSRFPFQQQLFGQATIALTIQPAAAAAAASFFSLKIK